MLKQVIHSLYYAIIPILILGIIRGYSTFTISIVSLLPLILTTNRHTLALFFIMYGGPLAGVTRSIYPIIPIYGLILNFIGLILIWDLIIDLLRNNIHSFWGMLVVLALFGFFYIIGPMDQFSTQKYLNLCLHGLMMLFAYYCLERSANIDVEALTRILLITAICMYAYVINAEGITPGGYFDFNWFRDQSLVFFRANDHAGSLVDYQHIGMLLLFSIAVYLSQSRLNLTLTTYYLACASYMILVSGCRQAIFGAALLITLRSIVFRVQNFNNKNDVGRFLWIGIGLMGASLLFLIVFRVLGSDVVTRTLTEGDAARISFYRSAVSIFQQNPVTGIGLGGFHDITGSVYPHNMFFELLCETGLLGVVASLVLLSKPLMIVQQGLLHLTGSSLFYFLIVLAIFVRVMVSSDLTESIELFSAVFAIQSVQFYIDEPNYHDYSGD